MLVCLFVFFPPFCPAVPRVRTDRGDLVASLSLSYRFSDNRFLTLLACPVLSEFLNCVCYSRLREREKRVVVIEKIFADIRQMKRFEQYKCVSPHNHFLKVVRGSPVRSLSSPSAFAAAAAMMSESVFGCHDEYPVVGKAVAGVSKQQQQAEDVRSSRQRAVRLEPRANHQAKQEEEEEEKTIFAAINSCQSASTLLQQSTATSAISLLATSVCELPKQEYHIFSSSAAAAADEEEEWELV